MARKIILIIILTLLSVAINLYGQNLEKVMSFKGRWKFSIGDDKEWANKNYDDSNWEWIRVPSQWEDQGYNGYNGYAWYRTRINIPSKLSESNLYLGLGRIDDVDEVYFNGALIGSSGTFPPNYKTAYNFWRNYFLPSELIQYNRENVIAVRVYDSQLGGGIVDGNIGIYESNSALRLDLNLAGYWSFTTGDDMQWKNQKETDWSQILVPASWESQGYENYDGFAWYQKSFKLPQSFDGRKLVLVMGKIDDIDEVYINGKLVGSTGSMKGIPVPERFNKENEYTQLRGYYIPDGVLKFGTENLISVRVYDGYNVGGIYEGPIGITDQNKYARFWRDQKRNKNYRERDLWDWIFN
jgi:sialate O-acetylesterase